MKKVEAGVRRWTKGDVLTREREACWDEEMGGMVHSAWVALRVRRVVRRSEGNWVSSRRHPNSYPRPYTAKKLLPTTVIFYSCCARTLVGAILETLTSSGYDILKFLVICSPSLFTRATNSPPNISQDPPSNMLLYVVTESKKRHLPVAEAPSNVRFTADKLLKMCWG